MEQKYSIAELIERIDQNWPEVSGVEGDIALSLIRLHDLGLEKAKKVFDSYDLSHAEFEVLFTLRSLPLPRELTPTELYKSILITSGGMTKVLKSLEKRGLIERLDNVVDKRSKLVKLTQFGQDIIESSMAVLHQSDKEFFGCMLKPEELEQLNGLLQKALKSLEK